MAERRSLGDAMNLTPEKLAFIKGQSVKERVASDTREAKEKTIELTPNELADRPSEPPRTASRRSRRGRSSEELPNASDLLDQVLVPVTIRLPHRTAQALKRAYLEQKLKHARPDTVQEIGEEALADWLEKAGYLD